MTIPSFSRSKHKTKTGQGRQSRDKAREFLRVKDGRGDFRTGDSSRRKHRLLPYLTLRGRGRVSYFSLYLRIPGREKEGRRGMQCLPRFFLAFATFLRRGGKVNLPLPVFQVFSRREGGIAAKAALCVIVALLFSRGRREESLKTTPQVGKRRERRVRVDGGFCTRRSFTQHWAAGGVGGKSMLHEFFPARTRDR